MDRASDLPSETDLEEASNVNDALTNVAFGEVLRRDAPEVGHNHQGWDPGPLLVVSGELLQ